VPQSHESLSRAIALMKQYKDIPTDFADDVLAAPAEDAVAIKGFKAYQIHRIRSFKIWQG